LVVNFSGQLRVPKKYPGLGHAARVEVLGMGGVMICDADHTDQICDRGPAGRKRICRSQRQHGIPAQRNAGRLGAGRILGSIATRRSWLDHLDRPSLNPERRRKTPRHS